MPDYKEWIKAVDVDIDYFSAYIKAWIAFNSWYRSEYPNGSDREIIEKIKNNDNRFKTYIHNYLNGTDSTSLLFQESIGKLHTSLNSAAITTQERGGVRVQISFTEIAVNNSSRIAENDYRQCHYKTQRIGDKIKTDVSHRTKSKVYFMFEQENYNIDELSLHAQFQILSDEQKQQCLANYRNICPYMTENILSSGDDAKQLGEFKFVNDNYKISRGIVEVLYLLRCSLMHGELSPDGNAKVVYQHAYEILRMVLKKLL